MYRNAISFHILILYLATLLNLCISSNNFGEGESLWFCIHNVMSSANSDSFTPEVFLKVIK